MSSKKTDKTIINPALKQKIKIVRILSCVSWIVPTLLYLAWIVIFSPRNSILLIPGLIGCFFFGFALFLFVASLEPQALGVVFSYKVFLPVLLVGLFLIGISMICTYIPLVYEHISEDVAYAYFMIWGILVIFIVVYIMFRQNITVHLRMNGLSRSAIKDLKKGKKNYWWYEALHKSHSFGCLYYLNKIFTILVLLTAGLHLFLGWWRPILGCVAFLTVIVTVLSCTMLIIGGMRSNFQLTFKKKRTTENSNLLGYLVLVAFLLQIAFAIIQKVFLLLRI